MVKTGPIDPGLIRRPEIETPRTESQYIPDARLTFIRSGQRWTFDGGRIQMDGQDIAKMIMNEAVGAANWMAIAEALIDYRNKIAKADREITDYARFSSLIDALIAKVMDQLHKAYDEKIFGLKWQLKNGQFMLNGINLRSFLALYRLRQTPQAKEFLKGLRDKMASIQSGRRHKEYEKLKEIIDDLVTEMDGLLEESASSLAQRQLRDRNPRG
ncbi:MAG: hypothetical protein Q7S00_03710 [bacterium]|nr:hypothetical protein [bacterium]